MKINDNMIIKCNNAEEYSWVIKELDKEDIFIFAIDPEHCMGIPERLNGREVNWSDKSYEKWFHDRRYFNIRSEFKFVHVMCQAEAIRMHFMRNYLIAEAKELMKKEENSNAIENNIQDEVEAYCYNDICFAETAFCDTNNISESKELMEENKMKKNVDYCRYDVEFTKMAFDRLSGDHKKATKCLVRTDIIPWENCGVIGTIPYKEAINDLEGTVLKVGDYVKVIDIRNEGSQIVTSIIVDNGNRLVPYCNKDYDGNKDILLIKVGEFPTYSHTVDPEKKEPRFITMDQSEFDKQALTYYKTQYENALSKLEVLQKKYDNSYRIQISLENTNELLKRKIDKMESHMNTTNELSDKDNISRESVIPPNEIILCRTKEECKWFIEEMEKIGNDNFYKFICAHDRISHITTEYLNDIFEDSCVTSVIFYFSYDTNPFIAYYYKHDEIEVYEKGLIIEASDLMKLEEEKDGKN